MKRFRWMAALLLLLAPAAAQADEIRWVGWSSDETKYAYFLRQPYGESGYTDVRLIVRFVSKDRLAARFTVQDARRLLEDPPKDIEKELGRREQVWLAELRSKGYRAGEALHFNAVTFGTRMAGGQTLPVMAAQVRMGRRFLTLVPCFTQTRAYLTAKDSLTSATGKRVAYTPLQSRVHMEGLPGERVYRIPPTHPTGVYRSSTGKWMSSSWQGRATLPDGFSWPAYLFHFPASSLPR